MGMSLAEIQTRVVIAKSHSDKEYRRVVDLWVRRGVEPSQLGWPYVLEAVKSDWGRRYGQGSTLDRLRVASGCQTLGLRLSEVTGPGRAIPKEKLGQLIHAIQQGDAGSRERALGVLRKTAMRHDDLVEFTDAYRSAGSDAARDAVVRVLQYQYGEPVDTLIGEMLDTRKRPEVERAIGLLDGGRPSDLCPKVMQAWDATLSKSQTQHVLRWLGDRGTHADVGDFLLRMAKGAASVPLAASFLRNLPRRDPASKKAIREMVVDEQSTSAACRAAAVESVLGGAIRESDFAYALDAALAEGAPEVMQQTAFEALLRRSQRVGLRSENRALVAGKVSTFLDRGDCSEAIRDLAQKLLARLKKYDRPNARILGKLERRRELAAKAMQKLGEDLKRRGLTEKQKREIEFQMGKLREMQATIEAQIEKFSKK